MYSPINGKIQKVWPCERVIESVSQTEAGSCRVTVVLDTLSAPCCFVRDAFHDTLEQLQHVARYAEELAEHKARKARLEEEAAEDETDDRPDDLPDDVPSKATITIKKIKNNRYYYWQWREGNRVKSKHKSPVNPDD